MDNSVVSSIISLLIILGLYAYFAYSIQTMAKKVGLQNTWLAWIPIANAFLLIQVADKPWWWFLLLLVPLVNIVMAFKLWIAVAKRMGQSTGMGVLVTIIPVCIGFLAFSTKPVMAASQAPAQGTPVR